jgi:hypothetical protein
MLRSAPLWRAAEAVPLAFEVNADGQLLRRLAS